MFINTLVYGALGNFKYYWIGGIMRTVMANGGKSVDVWTWTKGDALMIFSDWDPSAIATGNCSGVEGNSFWSAIDCNLSNPFVCEFPVSNCKIDNNYELCDDGWTHLNITRACYKKFSVITPMKQQTAENSCVQEGGHLASIHSIDENRFIGQLTSIGYRTYADASIFWIGAVRNDNSDNWRWTDKTRFDYTQWGDDFDYTGNFCVRYWPDYTSDHANILMVWNGAYCEGSSYSYLCKKGSYESK
uniref:C-type lectin domain-containing protein n=1 Tax=Panagrolaimus sp. JU765 TaxID=591449 RepID=A0AC34QAT2_9BILA